MIEYTKETWYDTKDEANRKPITHTHLNRIEEGIAAAVNAINEIEPFYVKACDVTREIQRIEPEANSTKSWKATEDCWLSVYASGSINSGTVGILKVNNVTIWDSDINLHSSFTNMSLLLPPCFFVKKDSAISFYRGGARNCNSGCIIYGCYK